MANLSRKLGLIWAKGKPDKTLPELDMSALVEQGIALGRTAFGLSLSCIVDSQTQEDHTAKYDFSLDQVVLFMTAVLKASQSGHDIGAIVKHSVAHEIGHAKEARAFAGAGFCPYGLRIDPAYSLRAGDLTLSVRQLYPLMSHLLTSIQDYGINATIHEHGMSDPDVYRELNQIQEMNKESVLDRPPRVMEELFNLPMHVGQWSFGDLSAQEKELMRGSAIDIVGRPKWDKTSEILKRRAYGDVSGYVDTVKSYLWEAFGMKAITYELSRDDLGQLASFWSERHYDIIKIPKAVY